MASQPSHAGRSRSGRPCSAVQIAFAWTSGPDISRSRDVGVGWTSCSVGAVAPTTTMRSRSTRVSALPRESRRTRRSGSCPAGRGSRSSAPPPGSARARAPGRRRARPRRRRASRSPPTACREALDDAAGLGLDVRRRRRARRRRRQVSSPPSTPCRRARRSRVVARTVPGRRARARRAARVVARPGRLGELDVVDDRARAGLAQRVDARACNRRGNGHCQPSSPTGPSPA